MKKLLSVFLIPIFIFALTACGSAEQISDPKIGVHTFTDSLGREVSVTSTKRVVALYGSFAEIWLNGGGTLVGTTEDAVSERELKLSDSIKIIGSVKQPNLEEIIALNPTLVLLSADIESQVKLADSLKAMNIPHAYMRVDLFGDYLNFLKIVTDITGRDELYIKNGRDIEEKINNILEKTPENSKKSVLLLRAYSSGAKAKTYDNFTGVMLKDLKTRNIAEAYPSLLEELSLEEIITSDPDYIFISIMGDEKKAIQSLNDTVFSNAAWQGLKAVKGDNVHILPKDLFHYKPNARWAEAYEYLAKILYPEVFKGD